VKSSVMTLMAAAITAASSVPAFDLIILCFLLAQPLKSELCTSDLQLAWCRGQWVELSAQRPLLACCEFSFASSPMLLIS
jgi:hypothetical protein